MKLLRVAPVAGIVLVAGCGHVVRTPAPASPAPTARYGELRAGLARAEITPPMGAGLFGYGPEGKKPEGFRHRLYARALVLEDARGERLAIVVADLGAVSTLLHREVAARLQQAGTRAISTATPGAPAAAAAPAIGADRLIIAATHTHSAPGNFLGMAYDEFASQPEVAGHDTVLLGFLAERIAGAVRHALADMRPARIAWGTTPVWGFTRNRALGPWAANRPRWHSPFPAPAGLSDAQRAVDPQVEAGWGWGREIGLMTAGKGGQAGGGGRGNVQCAIQGGRTATPSPPSKTPARRHQPVVSAPAPARLNPFSSPARS